MTNIDPFLVSGMSGDERVHVFRRVFDVQGAFDGLEVDAYIVTTERYIVMLDTMLFPDDAAAMMQQVVISRMERSVLGVNSHADWDHAWGNAYFSGTNAAPIIAHDHCRERLLSEEARQELDEFRQINASFQQVRLVAPTITFSESLTIDGGDLTIELLTAPGHHLDEIVAWIPELRLLLAFDAVEYPLPSVDGAQGVPLMFATLERLIALEPRRVLCSHGKTTDPQLIQTNLAYLREIERRCNVYLGDETRPLQQVDTPPSQLIAFPFDEVIAGHDGEFDRTFYSQAHEENIDAVLRWIKDL
ncbi:MAG TPA: MBL fold metallo-hydrolase [Ktedonobacteraceae bacterium]|nr:MBL fold metallo-hydrolase [Ktedonobacteraceae bacterium]